MDLNVPTRLSSHMAEKGETKHASLSLSNRDNSFRTPPVCYSANNKIHQYLNIS